MSRAPACGSLVTLAIVLVVAAFPAPARGAATPCVAARKGCIAAAAWTRRACDANGQVALRATLGDYVASWDEGGVPVHVEFRVERGPGTAVVAASRLSGGAFRSRDGAVSAPRRRRVGPTRDSGASPTR